MLTQVECGDQTRILSNPSCQSTSSIDPVIKDSREWYEESYMRFVVGDEEMENTLRLIYKMKGSLWSLLHVHVFGHSGNDHLGQVDYLYRRKMNFHLC